MNIALAVLKKEVIDALRDRKTMLAVLLSSVLIGPLMLVMISGMISDFESKAKKREIIVSGAENAPTLINYLARQTFTIKPAPADFEAQLKSSKLGDPVLVVSADFEKKLSEGEMPVVEIVSDSSNRSAGMGARRLSSVLDGFSQERRGLILSTRGVAQSALKSIDIEERDLADAQSRAAQFTGLIPLFVMMAVLYGALNAALDTSAGERERGSLEPLMATPISPWALVVGKWAAVAGVGMLIAILSALSFFPAQWFLKNESLQAMFQYGPKEAALFIALLVPFAAALSAVLMAVAIRCKTFKEAQASNTIVILVINLLPMITQLNPQGEKAWHLWIPGLGQNLAMTRVLKGETLSAATLLFPTLACIAIAAACLWFIARSLRVAAVK